ncbi:MAG: trypsin-like peptidase domain-containing protein [Candidatus Methylomirabilales bacterium]
MRRTPSFICLLVLLSVAGCALASIGRIESAISRYNENIGRVRIGMSEQEVRNILGDPSPPGYVYPLERTTLSDQTPVTILYYRTARIPDGLTTDDEMTPFLFTGDRLRAFGWRAVRVYRPGSEGQASTGTCFAVRPNGVILTAYHLIVGAKSIHVRSNDGIVREAKLLAFAAGNDIAILQIDSPTPNFLPLAPAGSVRSGDYVFTMGYPATDLLGQEPKFTEGSISSLSGPGGEASLLQVSVPVQPGNSGGPLVNERGEVVGVLTSTAAVQVFLSATGTLPQNVNWAVKTDYARPMFDVPIVKSVAGTRTQAIAWTRNAICKVEASPR